MTALALLVASTVAAAPTEPVKLGSLGLTGLGVPADKLQYYSDHFAQQLSVRGLRVVTQSELAALVGLERQKELLGCAEGTSCTAEITQALGVDGLVTGSLGLMGDEFQLDVKVVATGDRPPLSVYSRRGRTSALLDELALASWQVAVDVLHALRPGVEPPPKPALGLGSSGPSGLRHLAWIPVAASFIVALVSIPYFNDARNHHTFLATSQIDLFVTTPQQYAADGITAQNTAAGLVVAAAALMAVGVFIFTWFTLR